MKKTAIAAVALAGLAALTGASAAPATTASGSKAATAHTLRWKLFETSSHNVGKRGFVGADTIRSRRTGKIVGYDSTTGIFAPKTNSARIQVAASVRGGILVGQVHGVFSSNDVVFHGRILKGTGRFAGVQGTITAKPIGGGQRTAVRIEYVK